MQFQCTTLAAVENRLRGRGEKEWEALAIEQVRGAFWGTHRHGNIEGDAVFRGREEVTNQFLDMLSLKCLRDILVAWECK